TGSESRIQMESKPGSLFPGTREPRKGRNHTEGNATTPLRQPQRLRIQTPQIHSVCRRLPVRLYRPSDGSRRNEGKNHNVPQNGTETHLISRKNADDACPRGQSKVSRLRNRYYAQLRQVRQPKTTSRQWQSRIVHTRGRHANKAQTVSQGREADTSP